MVRLSLRGKRSSTLSFSDAVRTCFQKYSEFSGRARPSEYWWWTLFYIGAIFVLGFVSGAMSGDEPNGLFFLVVITWLGLLLPTLAVTVRRLHDTGRSGWYWFISFIPLVGPIIMLVFLVSAGNPGPNQYGEPITVTASLATPSSHR